MDSAAVLQQLTSLVGAALKTLSAIRDAGHLASPNSQQNKNETARVLPPIWRSRRVWIRAWRTACGVCPYPLSNLSFRLLLATALRDNSGPNDQCLSPSLGADASA